jgi:glucosamine-6-phosphate deaminase
VNKIICTKIEQFAQQADAVILTKIRDTKARCVFLPSGGTPQALYSKWERERPSVLEGLEFTQLDEIIDGPLRGSFEAFFKSHLPSYFSQFTSLEAQQQQPEVVVLGLGPNGHVAFHEPGVPKDFYKGVVELSPATCQRMNQPPGVRGLTYGVSCFLKAKSIVLLIQGKDKEAVTEAFFNNPMADFPAAHLRDHADLTVVYLPPAAVI